MADVTVKISEHKFGELFHRLIGSLPPEPVKGQSPGADEVDIPWGSDSGEGWSSTTSLDTVVPVFGVDAVIRLVGAGGIEFNDSNTFTANEVDIAWDKFIFTVGIDVPSMKVGGFCLFRLPKDWPLIGGKCAVPVPPFELFTKSPDIQVPLDLSPLLGSIVTEVSAICSIEVRDGGAEWDIHADPVAVDADLVDIQDTMGQLPGILSAAVAVVVLNLKMTFPAPWLVDVFLGFVGLPSLTTVVLDMLDIHDDIQEWMMKQLEFSIGIDNLLTEVIADAVLDSVPIFHVPKRYEIVGTTTKAAHELGPWPGGAASPGSVNLPAVELPIKMPDARFTGDEMIVAFDLEV